VKDRTSDGSERWTARNGKDTEGWGLRRIKAPTLDMCELATELAQTLLSCVPLKWQDHCKQRLSDRNPAWLQHNPHAQIIKVQLKIEEKQYKVELDISQDVTTWLNVARVYFPRVRSPGDICLLDNDAVDVLTRSVLLSDDGGCFTLCSPQQGVHWCLPKGPIMAAAAMASSAVSASPSS